MLASLKNMNDGAKLARIALRPLTFGGVASFAGSSIGRLPLVELIVAGALHLVLGWVYLIFAPRKLPALESTGRVASNPFKVAPEDKEG